MTTLRIAALAGLGAIVVSTSAFGQSFGVVDVSAGYTRLSDDNLDLDAATLRGTVHATRNLGGEVEVNFGVGDDALGAAQVELDSNWGVYARGDLPIADSGAVFARVGYVDQQTTSTIGGTSTSNSQDGWAAGVGGEFFVFGLNGVRIDYTHFEFDDDSADAASISFVRRVGG